MSSRTSVSLRQPSDRPPEAQKASSFRSPQWLRLGLAAGLLAGLLSFVGVGELVDTFRNVTLLSIFNLTVISVVMIWTSAVKWQLFVRASGGDVPVLRLMKLYTIAYFFNLFFPSAIGGDVVRSYQLGSLLKSRRDGFIATFFERFTGLMTMTATAVVFVLLGNEVTAGIEAAVFLVGAAVAAGAFVCFSERGSALAFSSADFVVSRLGRPALQARLSSFLSKVREGFQAMRGSPTLLWKALFLSFVFHALTVANTKLCADAIGWTTASVGGLFVVVPLVLLIGVVPLTPNGIGIQEGAFLFFLERIGATHSEALAVGLLIRAKVTIIGIIGGLLWLSEKRSRDTA